MPNSTTLSHSRPSLDELAATISALRGPDGCPWDRKQTTETMVKYLQSELEELVQAIKNEDTENICEELGDLLFIIMMISDINRDEGKFDLQRVASTINEKLVRRHPHVFAEQKRLSEEELKVQWEQIKAAEKAQKLI